jgi:hypothetical protein
MKRSRLPLWIGDALVALLVIALLAAGAFGSWKLFEV